MSSELVQRPVMSVECDVTDYDRVSGGLSASVIVMGGLALVMVMMWLAMQPGRSGAVTPIPPGGGQGDMLTLGVAADIEEPGVEEFPELTEPMLIEAMAAVDVPSTVRANDATGNAASMGRGQGLGGNGKDGRPFPIILKQDDDSNWKRWQINYTVTSIYDYRKQLDALKIELAGAGKKGDSVVYCTAMSTAPQLREGSKADEKRVYFQHRKPLLRLWDLAILRTAGVENANEFLPVHFYPTDMMEEMRRLEEAQLKKDGRKAEEVKQTQFLMLGESENYELVLEKLEYLE